MIFPVTDPTGPVTASRRSAALPDAATGRRDGCRAFSGRADDVELLPAIRRLVDRRPTCGHRRIAALRVWGQERRGVGLEPVDRKRALRSPGRRGVQGKVWRRSGPPAHRWGPRP